MGQQNYARLVHLSEAFRSAKTSLAGDLLEAAITDAWNELGLPEPASEEPTGYDERGAHTDVVRESSVGSLVPPQTR